MTASRERWGPYAVVLVLGLLFAAGAAIGADRQPLVWAMPPLVLTGVLLGVFALSDHRREDRVAETTAEELGLRDTGLQPLPPLTPVLARAEPARVLAGHLDDGTPYRLAQTRSRRVGLAVCVTEIADRGRAACDPHGIVESETTVRHDIAAWVNEHPRRLAFVAESGTLVVATPVPRGRPAPFAALLTATRELRPLLSDSRRF